MRVPLFAMSALAVAVTACNVDRPSDRVESRCLFDDLVYTTREGAVGIDENSPECVEPSAAVATNPSPSTKQSDERPTPSDEERHYSMEAVIRPPQDEPRVRRVDAPYEVIRNGMIAEGYRPRPVGNRTDCEDTFYVDVCRRYPEVVDCSGTGAAYCEFNFVNQQGRRLSVITKGETDLTAVLIRAPE